MNSGSKVKECSFKLPMVEGKSDNELHACSFITIMSSYRIEDLQVKLYEVTEIDKEEQELLAYSGQTVEPTTPVMDICKKSSQV